MIEQSGILKKNYQMTPEDAKQIIKLNVFGAKDSITAHKYYRS